MLVHHDVHMNNNHAYDFSFSWAPLTQQTSPHPLGYVDLDCRAPCRKLTKFTHQGWADLCWEEPGINVKGDSRNSQSWDPLLVSETHTGFAYLWGFWTRSGMGSLKILLINAHEECFSWEDCILSNCILRIICPRRQQTPSTWAGMTGVTSENSRCYLRVVVVTPPFVWDPKKLFQKTNLSRCDWKTRVSWFLNGKLVD